MAGKTDYPRKGAEYDKGELETILSLVPTKQNVKRLSQLLKRSEDAIKSFISVRRQTNGTDEL